MGDNNKASLFVNLSIQRKKECRQQEVYCQVCIIDGLTMTWGKTQFNPSLQIIRRVRLQGTEPREWRQRQRGRPQPSRRLVADNGPGEDEAPGGGLGGPGALHPLAVLGERPLRILQPRLCGRRHRLLHMGAEGDAAPLLQTNQKGGG
jgi:hypothetical protein